MSRTIKNFATFSMITEGRIPTYLAGDTKEASKSLSVPNVAEYFVKLLQEKKPFSAVVNNEGPEFGPASRADAEEGEWHDRTKNVEYDIVGVESFKDKKKDEGGKLVFTDTKKIETPEAAKKTDPNFIAIVLRSKDGKEWKIQIGKIEEVYIGSSEKDGISVNTPFFVHGKGKGILYDFDGKDVTFQYGEKGSEKETMSLADWKKTKKE